MCRSPEPSSMIPDLEGVGMEGILEIWGLVDPCSLLYLMRSIDLSADEMLRWRGDFTQQLEFLTWW